MSATHTPGPWHHDREKFADWGWVRDAYGFLVARCNIPRGTDENQHRLDDTDPTEANARLIAASPDLLEVLESLLEMGACVNADDEIMENKRRRKIARAAIAKAKGETE